MKTFVVNRFEPVTFTRGEFVLIQLASDQLEDGIITNISHARRKAKARGVWYRFDQFYKIGGKKLK